MLAGSSYLDMRDRAEKFQRRHFSEFSGLQLMQLSDPLCLKLDIPLQMSLIFCMHDNSQLCQVVPHVKNLFSRIVLVLLTGCCSE
jgi:hypothetical protein